jgi:hypothetical protein
MNRKIESRYIINVLRIWAEKYEGIHIKYAYDKGSEFHIVYVTPDSIRRGSDEYMHDELELYDNFHKEFRDSDLLITNPLELDDMSNLLYNSDND